MARLCYGGLVRRAEGEERHRLETSRLVLRPCTPSDLDHLHALWTDPDVRRYLWDDEVISRDVAEGVITASLASFAQHGFGQWVVLDKSSGEPIGFCGLRAIEGTSEIELLYGLTPAYWSRGVATEAAHAVLAYGFATVGLPRIAGRTDSPNRASARVLERLGMVFEGERPVAGRPTLHYILDRPRRP